MCVVVFASEQVFPSLQFVLHVAHHYRNRLASLHIYSTPDERRSAEPAKRMAQAVAHWLDRNGQGAAIEIITAEASPHAVRKELLQWFHAAPESLWLVNVTGGTKPMSAAATELTLATDLPHRRVIYQEITGAWWEMGTDEQGLLDSRPLRSPQDPVVPPASTLERLLPVTELVAAQFSGEHEVTVREVDAFRVDEALTQVMRAGWSWRDGLAAMCPRVVSKNHGDAFERFIAAGLLGCGLRLHHSLEVRDPHSSHKVVREVDLVGCHLGRLICMDIKLPGAEEHAKGTQLADVAELAQSLGGRGALAIAIRPGWPEDSDIERLARALGVRLVTQGQAAGMFSAVLQMVDPALQPSAAVLEAEAMMRGETARGNAVLSDGSLVQSAVKDSGVVVLTLLAEHIARKRREPWSLFQISGNQYGVFIPKKQVPAEVMAHWADTFDALLQELSRRRLHGTRVTVGSNTAAWAHVEFTLGQGIRIEVVRQVLRSLLLPAQAEGV